MERCKPREQKDLKLAERAYFPDELEKGRAIVSGDEAHHLARVRRVAVGQEVELFDGRGLVYRGRVANVERGRVEIAVAGEPLPDRVPRYRLTLAAAVPKGERFDWLVEKATELGVVRLVPLITEHSVVDPRRSKLGRLRRLIIEACKQCGRNRLMELAEPMPWPEYHAAERAQERWLAHPDRPGLAVGSWPAFPEGQTIALAIGPEGGFSAAEADAALGAGWRILSLGPTILRIETAAVAGAAAILLGMPGGSTRS